MSLEAEPQNYAYTPQSLHNPYNPNVLETVQSATIGSAAVRYTTTDPIKEEAPVAVAEPVKEVELVTSDDICRDFTNGSCGRFDCKYKHETETRNVEHAPVCKDYQNDKCYRPSCKFLHLTKTEAEEFEKTGIMPEKTSIVPEKKVFVVDPRPCRDYVKGMCRRGTNCKFTHGGGGTPLQGKRPFSALTGTTSMPNGSPQQVNEQLKAKLLDLRNQVTEVAQLNGTLYSENQKFRDQLGGESTVGKMSLLPKPYAANGVGY